MYIGIIVPNIAYPVIFANEPNIIPTYVSCVVPKNLKIAKIKKLSFFTIKTNKN